MARSELDIWIESRRRDLIDACGVLSTAAQDRERQGSRDSAARLWRICHELDDRSAELRARRIQIPSRNRSEATVEERSRYYRKRSEFLDSSRGPAEMPSLGFDYSADPAAMGDLIADLDSETS